MNSLTVFPIQTSIYRDGDLADFIVSQVPSSRVQEKMVIAITSKIVSLAEGRLVPQNQMSKEELVKREADTFIGEIAYGCFLTVKEGLLIPSAGIDESNSENGNYILYPESPSLSAEKIWQSLRSKWGLKHLGVILTDSHTTPLRRGVTGVALSYRGFRPVKLLVGENDLFGRQLQMTSMNLADGLAAAAVLTMGEAAECRPLAIIHGAELEFSEAAHLGELSIPLEEDLYGPLLKRDSLVD